jgi:hypothetical protein
MGSAIISIDLFRQEILKPSKATEFVFLKSLNNLNYLPHVSVGKKQNHYQRF